MSEYTKKPKILIAHEILWSHYAGSVFSSLYNLCKKNDFDFLVVDFAKTSNKRKNLGDIDLSIHKYPYKILFKENFEEIHWYKKFYYLLKEINTFRPSVVIMGGYNNAPMILAAFLNKLLRIKTILATDTTIYDRKRNWIKEILKKIILKSFDYAFCVGTPQINYIKSLGFKTNNIFMASCYAVDEKKIKATYLNSTEDRENKLKLFGFQKKNFIYVGRLSKEKNIDILLNAFNNIKDKGKDWGLIIVGDGPYRESLENIVRKEKIKDVFFTGGKSWTDVPIYYALSDVFILPSISEPWGLVVNEAMICGLPIIISSRVGASFDLIKDGVNGFIFDPFNAKELTELMLRFVNEDVDKSLMGKESKEIIKEFTVEKFALNMFNSLKIILDKNN